MNSLMSFTKKLTLTHFLSGLISIVFFANIAKAGGVSGGGGFVINPLRPISPQSAHEIEHLIEGSKSVLIKYIQHKKNQLNSNSIHGHQKQLYHQLLNSKNGFNFENTVSTYNIHIEDEEPCYTTDHIAVDGSIFAEESNSICISSSTIAEKVRQTEVSKQTAALMLHEMIEVVGLSDEDAITLQKIALAEIK